MRLSFILATLALASPAAAQTADHHLQVYLRIVTDISCGPHECQQLLGWRLRVAELCHPGISSAAADRCSAAQIGLSVALAKANSYGYGWFTE